MSTTDQHPHLQVDALTAAGCYRVFTETASGARTNRPTLEQLLDQLRPGDTLIVGAEVGSIHGQVKFSLDLPRDQE